MIPGGGDVLLYCLLGAGGGAGYFQVDSVITVRVFRLACGQIIGVGGSNLCPVRVHNITDIPPYTVNLTSQRSSKQDQRSVDDVSSMPLKNFQFQIFQIVIK